MLFKRIGKVIATLLVVVAVLFVCFKAIGYIEQMKMSSIVNSEEAKINVKQLPALRSSKNRLCRFKS